MHEYFPHIPHWWIAKSDQIAPWFDQRQRWLLLRIHFLPNEIERVSVRKSPANLSHDFTLIPLLYTSLLNRSFSLQRHLEILDAPSVRSFSCSSCRYWRNVYEGVRVTATASYRQTAPWIVICILEDGNTRLLDTFCLENKKGYYGNRSVGSCMQPCDIGLIFSNAH